MVSRLIDDLLRYLKSDKDILLIKSCVFHYGLEFIHPFTDGNGRMGRLWQTLILKTYSPVFEYLPVESIIKEKQAEYYKALSISDKQGKSTAFIEFMLNLIEKTLEKLLKSQPVSLSGNERILLFKDKLKDEIFTRKDYMRAFKELSTATASRDLKEAVQKKILLKKGDKRTTRYRFRKK